MPPAAIAGAGLAAAAGGSIIGGKMAADAQSDAANQAASLRQQATNQYANVAVPTVEEQMLQLEKIKASPNLTPEMEATINQTESQLNSYSSNPEAMTALSQALQKFQTIGNSTTLDPAAKAQLNQTLNQLNSQEQSNRNAITQNYAQRGMAGSGVQLASQLAGNQAATTAAANQGVDVASQAWQRALNASAQGANTAQQLESMGFGEANAKGQAQNAINQFNAANQQNVLGQNVQRQNYSDQYNNQTEQQRNAANTTIANQEQAYNKGLYQQGFGNEMQKAQGMANALGGQANTASASGNAAANLYSGIGNAAAKIGTGIADYGVSMNNTDNTANNTKLQNINNKLPDDWNA